MGSRRNANKPGGSVSDFSMEDIKEALLPGIRSAIKADMEEVIKSTLGDRLDRIEARLGDLTQLQQVVTDLRKATADTSERMDDLLKVTIPALTRHFEDVTSALVMRQLDQDMHRRKWSLAIQGLPGDAKEDEGDTRRTCVEFAKKHLGVGDASEQDFAACHRLNQRSDAGIIARFVDLQQRDQWLLGARGLKNSDMRVSISPDLPPVVRPLKKELLEKRRTLPPNIKSKAHIRYLRQWPYVELSMGKDKDPIRPSCELRTIVQSFLGDTPLSVPLETGTILVTWSIIFGNYKYRFSFSQIKVWIRVHVRTHTDLWIFISCLVSYGD